MRKLITISLLIAALSACAGQQYGNYTKISEAYNTQMADDTAHKLITLYPPASTHLQLSQSTKDAYGTELIKKLRESGYALEDGGTVGDLFAVKTATQVASGSTTPNGDRTNNSALAEKPVSTVESSTSTVPVKNDAPAKAPGFNTPLGYVVDQISEGLYRVTVSVGSQAISRVYSVSGTTLAPAGSWTRKE